MGALVIAMVAVTVVLVSRDRERPVAPAIAMPSGSSAIPAEPTLPVVPRSSVVARVTFEGKPAPDVEVSITDGSQPVLARVWTDREGVARFDDLPDGPYELWATGDSLASAPVRLELARDADLVLEPAANVRGQVTADGFVPPTSTITLVPLDGDHAARIAAIDNAGRFALDGVPLGKWRIETSMPGHVQSSEPVVRIADREAQIAVRVARTSSVAGIVVDSNGAPVSNATIVLRDQSGASTARPLTLAATGLRWVHPLASVRMMPVWESARFMAARSGHRPSECGKGHCGIDIGGARGSIVHAATDGEIVMIHSESRSEAGKFVAIHHGGGMKSFYMHLDEVRPGLEIGQSVRAGEPVGTLGSTGFTRGVSPPHVHFAITHEHRGRTWYLDPEPVLRHAVVLPASRTYEAFEPGPTLALAAAPVVHRISTDARGAFRVDGIAPGSYVAGVFAMDYAPGVSSPFSVKSGEDTVDVRITLDAGIAVRGVVIGRDGPLPGAVVTAQAGFGESAHKIGTAVSDKSGRFTLRALSGKVTISVNAPSYGESERTLVVDERTREQTFTLTIENGRLRGQVLASDGGAAAGVTVRVVDGPTRRRTVTDAQGRFTLERVADGKYTLELSSPDFPTKRIDAVSEQWREVRLDVGGGARILVRDAQSAEPLANARVELAGPNGQTSTRSTNTSGILEARGLVPGDWKITARIAGYTHASKTASVRARLVDDVQIELARGATIAGTVRDRYGRRVAGARVSLGEATAKTDQEGNFRIAGAPVGAGVIEAEFDGTRGTLPVELSPGSERAALVIELQ